jgi:hypothetical protein
MAVSHRVVCLEAKRARKKAHAALRQQLGCGDGALRQKLEAAIPLGEADCPFWGPLEFWACYGGLRPVPEVFSMSPAPVIGPRQAALLSGRWGQQLRSLFDAHQLDTATALDALMQLAGAGASIPFPFKPAVAPD